MFRAVLLLSLLCLCGADAHQSARPTTGKELAYWLANMTRHEFTPAEMSAATGLREAEIRETLRNERLSDPKRVDSILNVRHDRLLALPYPGGRHPRTGFLEGAIDPQRETKVSIFAPWDASSYVVVDVPEAIFTNLGLTYLAHTHVPTIWSQSGTTLEPLEWTVTDDGLELERVLPNGIRFGSKVSTITGSDCQLPHVEMELWLTNGTPEPLTGMRVQNCVMLKAAIGFHDQTNSNKLLRDPFVAVHDETGRYWIITAWTPNHRAWANPPVPCLHSDPTLPDCLPGGTVRAHGRLWFYEGTDIDAELARLARELPPVQ